MKKHALITGASRGIGKAVALRLADMGYDLLLTGRDEAALSAVADRCRALGVDTVVAPGDLTQEAFIAQLAQTLRDAFSGTVDVLINNAGGGLNQPIHEADLSAWRTILDLNFTATASLCAKLLPSMIERGSGAIINISSISGRNTEAGSAIYSASKHALNGLTGCMFEDVRDHGVKVTTIMPGFVATDLTAKLPLNVDHMIRASDVADAVAYVITTSEHCCPTEIVLRPQRRP